MIFEEKQLFLRKIYTKYIDEKIRSFDIHTESVIASR